MPRIWDADEGYTLDEVERHPEIGLVPYDYCRRCWATAVRKASRLADVDTDHPPYDEEEYDCDHCGKRLTGRDDWV